MTIGEFIELYKHLPLTTPIGVEDRRDGRVSDLWEGNVRQEMRCCTVLADGWGRFESPENQHMNDTLVLVIR